MIELIPDEPKMTNYVTAAKCFVGGSGLLVLKYFYFLASNTHSALVVALSEKASTIQHGYRKCGTHARVFSQTPGTARMK